MRQVFYPGELTEAIAITGGDAHHLAHVMRAQIGDVITVVDAAGQAAEMAVTALTRDAVHLRMQRVLPAETADREAILVQALLKGEKMDFVVQKAAELGAVCVCPIVTEHVVVRYDAKKAAAVTAAGGQSVSLGHRILRAETASLTALAVTQYELGNLGKC